VQRLRAGSICHHERQGLRVHGHELVVIVEGVLVEQVQTQGEEWMACPLFVCESKRQNDMKKQKPAVQERKRVSCGHRHGPF
jgi:hypothetical protein